MKRLIGISIVAVLALGMLTACSKNEAHDLSEENPKIYSEGTEFDKDSNILHFVDAHGEWHDMVINPNIRPHNYDWNGLSNDGQTVGYEGDYAIKKGIDVSKYQGEIDWNKVASDGYEFVIIRIAYRGYGQTGSLNLDDTFYTYFEGARKAGLDVGVYIFSQAINEAEAEEEAEFVLDALKGEELELPIVFDPELIKDDEARTDNVTGEQFTRNTIAFCEKVKAAGYEPMVYSNMVWEAELFDMEQLQDYPVWYADYEATPQTPYDFSMWQYTEKGQVDGIEGACDLDVLFEKK